MGKYLLGIDIGGTGIKAVVCNELGNTVSQCNMDTPVSISNGKAQLDMEELWNMTCKAISHVINNIDKNDIACIGVCGHGKGLYLWGKDNKPGYYGIVSTDVRAEDICRIWREDGTEAKASEYSLQSILSCQPPALLAWLKDNEPDVYNNIQWIFEAKDYIRFRLTGEAYAEVTDYSGTGLMNLKERKIDKRLFDIYGISDAYYHMPEIRNSTDICGCVTEETAKRTGLMKGTPVCGGMFDIDACAVAAGVIDTDKLCMITGTWSINEYISHEPVMVGSTTRNSFFCLPDHYLIEESSPTSAGNLEWYIKNILHEDNRDKKQIYADINKAVMSAPADKSNICFLPYIYGTNTAWNGNGAFIGIVSESTQEDMLRAVFEGVVFSHMLHLDNLLMHRSKPLSVCLTGGAAKSAVWAQLFADICGIPIETVENDETGTLGVSIAAAVSVGMYGSITEAVSNMVNISKVYVPNQQNSDIYKRKYETFKKYARGNLL